MTQSFESADRFSRDAALTALNPFADWSSKNNQGADRSTPGQKAGQAGAEIPHSAHVPALQLVDAVKAAGPGPQTAADGHASEAPADSHAAPTISGSHPGFLSEAGNVGQALWDGVKNEVVNNPGDLLDTAEAAAIEGVVTGGLITLAVGAGAVSAPAIAAGAIAIGAVYAGAKAYEAIENRDAIIKNTSMVADPEAYSAKEVAAARRTVENAGGDGLKTVVEIGAGAAGGFGVNIGINAALSSAASGEALAQPAAGAAAFTDKLKPIHLLPLLTGLNKVLWEEADRL